MVRTDGAQPSSPAPEPAAEPAATRPIRFPIEALASDRGRRAAQELGRAGVESLQERALRVLLKGVVHRMNNLLAVQSSHAQLLSLRTRTGQPVDGRHLLDSIDRGNFAMSAVGALLELPGSRDQRFEVHEPDAFLRGPSTEARTLCLGSFLRALEDVVLLERHGQRLPLDVQAALQVYGRLTRGPLLAILCVLIDHLCEAVPPDVPGRIALGLAPGAEGPSLTLGFERADQQLPFPVEPAELPLELALYLTALGVRWTKAQGRAAYELQLP
ncbi:MAG: hypothetical protein R3F30_10840 [Planctomycetota bacterium]